MNYDPGVSSLARKRKREDSVAGGSDSCSVVAHSLRLSSGCQVLP